MARHFAQAKRAEPMSVQSIRDRWRRLGKSFTNNSYYQVLAAAAEALDNDNLEEIDLVFAAAHKELCYWPQGSNRVTMIKVIDELERAGISKAKESRLAEAIKAEITEEITKFTKLTVKRVDGVWSLVNENEEVIETNIQTRDLARTMKKEMEDQKKVA